MPKNSSSSNHQDINFINFKSIQFTDQQNYQPKTILKILSRIIIIINNNKQKWKINERIIKIGNDMLKRNKEKMYYFYHVNHRLIIWGKNVLGYLPGGKQILPFDGKFFWVHSI